MQDKFKLPQLNELKETFKFELEENDKIFDQIRNEISERIFTFTEKIIEPVIAGSESYSCIFEQEMLTDEERQKLFDIYKKIQVLKWENNLLMLHPDEKKAAAWVKKTWEIWNSEIEAELSKTCKKLSSSWGNLRFKNERPTYNG
ncbi:MAG: seg [archaeon GW2011_AR5]|nr:MAG: seg [archaeon GW2011_AR5]